MTLKHKIKHKHSFTRFNRQALKVPKHAENVNNALVAALGPTELPGPADQRYSALKSAVSAAVKTLPKPQPKGLAIRSQSKKTESLVEQRRRDLQATRDPAGRKAVKLRYRKSCSKDSRSLDFAKIRRGDL